MENSQSKTILQGSNYNVYFRDTCFKSNCPTVDMQMMSRGTLEGVLFYFVLFCLFVCCCFFNRKMNGILQPYLREDFTPLSYLQQSGQFRMDAPVNILTF